MIRAPDFARKSHHPLALIACTLLFTLPQTDDAGADWPGYRHDARRSGVAETSPTFPLSNAWRFRTPHPPRPSWGDPARADFWHRHRELQPHIIFDRAPQVVTAGGKAYLGDTVDDTIRCLDLTTGKLLWSFPTGGPIRCAPTLTDGKLLTGSDDGRVYCLDARTGKLLWSACPKEASRMIADDRLISRLPIRTDILVDEEDNAKGTKKVAYFGAGLFPLTEGTLVCAVDLQSGKILSAMPADRPIQGYLAKRGRKLVFPSGRIAPGGALVDDGKGEHPFRWQPTPKGPGGDFAMLSDGLIVTGPGFAGRLALIDTKSNSTITELPGVWMISRGDRFYIQSRDEIYALDGPSYCRLALEMRELEKQCQQIKRRSGADAAEKIAKHKETIKRLQQERDACELWRTKSDNPYAMVLAGETIFVGGDCRVCAFDAKGGQKIWEGEVEGRAYGLAVDCSDKSGAQLLVSTDEGYVYAFAADKSTDIATTRPTRDIYPRLLARESNVLELEWPARPGDESYLLYGPADSLPPTERAEMVTINHCRIAQLDRLKPDTRYAIKIVDGPNAQADDAPVHHMRTRPSGIRIASALNLPDGSLLGDWVSRALRHSGKRGSRGFCLIPQPKDPQAGIEIASRSGMHVVLLQNDITKADSWRRKLLAAGLLGRSISVHTGGTDSLPPYFANAIIVDPRNTCDAVSAKSESILRLVAPEGGLLVSPILSQSDTVLANRATLDAFGYEDLGSSAVHDGSLNCSRRGPLAGAGSWDHGIGDPGNTACSGEENVGGPMRVLWFGPPGPRQMADRHHRNPAPLYRDGRLFVPGDQTIQAVNAYNGTPLWKKVLPGSRRLGVFLDCSNLAVGPDHLYAVVGPNCHRFHTRTGIESEKFTIPQSPSAREESSDEPPAKHWGYLAMIPKARGSGENLGQVIGSVTKSSAAYTEMSRKGDDVLWHDAMKLVTSDRLFVLDAESGKPVWQREFNTIINSTITIGDRQIYFLQSLSQKAADDPLGRSTMKLLGSDGLRLVALDLKTGKTAWKQEVDPLHLQYIAYLSFAKDRLVLSGNRYIDKKLWYTIDCLDATNGQAIWRGEHSSGYKPGGSHGEQNRHPTLVGNRIYAYPYAYELETGERVPNWKFSRGGHGCGNVSASMRSLFIRGGNPRQIDLTKAGPARSQSVNGVSRPGCWINMIPAGGLLMIPEASSGCSCRVAIQTTLTYVPERELLQERSE